MVHVKSQNNVIKPMSSCGNKGIDPKFCKKKCKFTRVAITVVPVMNGHPRDQAKVSVHCRWPLVTGTDGQAGDAKYNTPCNTT